MFVRRGLTNENCGKDTAKKMVWDSPSRKTRFYRKFAKVLKLDDNKTELFNLIADTLSGLFRNQQKVLLITLQQTALSNREVDLQCFQPSCKEEADDRIFLRAMEQSQLQFKRLVIVTVDPNAVVISLYAYWDLNVTELWIEFDTRKDRWWLPVHSYAKLLGETKGLFFAEGLFFGICWPDVIRYHNSLGMANQLHEKHGRLDTFIKLFGILNSKSEILLSNYRIPEKSQPKILKWLIISLSSCMIWPVRMKLLASTASIYLHRWIAQCTIANLHEMPCCNILTGGCHSQTYEHIKWHSTKMIKICYIRVGFWWNTAPVKGFVLETFIRAKNTTFCVQTYVAAKGIVKIRLIYGLCLITSFTFVYGGNILSHLEPL